MTNYDTLMTVFATTGLSAVLSAFQSMEQATARLGQAEERAYYKPTIANHNALLNAMNSLKFAQIQLGQTLIQTGVGALESLAAAAENAMRKYMDLAKQIQDIKDITGASGNEATQAALLAKVAGIEDMGQLKELLHVNQAIYSAQGRSALGLLGVPANPNTNSLKLMNQVLDAYKKSQLPQSLKIHAMEDIFGARNLEAALRFARIPADIRDRTVQMASSFDDKVVPALQHFEYATNLAGQAILVRLVFPILEKLLPVLDKVVTALVHVVDFLGNINDATGGVLGMAVAFAAVAVGVGLVIRGLYAMSVAMKLNVVLAAALDAFSGNWVNLAAGAAVAAAAGIGIWGLGKAFSQTAQDTGAGDLKDAAKDLKGAAGIIGDTFGKYNKGGIPSHLVGDKGYSLGALSQAMKLKAIG